MIEELLKDLTGQVKRCADALEAQLTFFSATTGATGPGETPEAATETSPPVAPTTGKTGKGKAAAAKAETPKPAETPAASGPSVEEDCLSLRAIFSDACKKDNPGARKLFKDYREEVGIEEIDKMSFEQRADLKARLQKFIDGEAEEDLSM
jgi:hypothetical protein